MQSSRAGLMVDKTMPAQPTLMGRESRIVVLYIMYAPAREMETE